MQGTCKAESALKIASGASEESDSDVLLNSEGLPYIPGTSLAGALYAALVEKSNLDNIKLYSFWGRDNSRESHLDIAHCNLVSEKVIIEFRDGIAINQQTQQTQKNAKYDYQVIPAGVEFNYSIVVNDTGEEGISKDLASYVAKIFEQGILIGGHKNKGKGLLKSIGANHRHFDFTQEKHVYEWIDRDFEDGGEKFNPDPTVELKKPGFMVSGSFKIPNALIIGSAASANNSKSDKTHLKSGGKYILSGTALKGALKARARIIANTIGMNDTEKMLDDLFGRKSENQEKIPEKKKKRLSSRFMCNEPFIERGAESIQHRIKIDRFTGGTIKGGLFDSEPLWGGTIANLSFSVNDPTKEEVELLLLVFADLFRGDIVFGGEKNIGRGVIKGKKALISIHGKEFPIPATEGNQSFEELDEYVEELSNLKTA